VIEAWEELLEVALEWSFLPVALGLLLLCVVGSGAWRTRWRKSLLLLGLVLWGFALYFGIQRHEWGEVLFNGQLL